MLLKIYCENIVIIFLNQDFLLFILFLFSLISFYPYISFFFSYFSPPHTLSYLYPPPPLILFSFSPSFKNIPVSSHSLFFSPALALCFFFFFPFLHTRIPIPIPTLLKSHLVFIFLELLLHTTCLLTPLYFYFSFFISSSLFLILSLIHSLYHTHITDGEQSQNLKL